MSNKLELTWIGKEKIINIEPRILLEVPELSNYGKKIENSGQTSLFEDNTGQHFDNMLIHGDNLLALKALEGTFAGRIKCIYIDPRRIIRVRHLNIMTII
jgi:adenine-specific DNA-methyltransferase